VTAPPPARDPHETTRAIVKAAVEEAVAPLRRRIEELEQRALEESLQEEPSPSERTTLPAPEADVQREIPQAQSVDSALERLLDGGLRRRRTVVAAVAVTAVGLVALFAMLAACN
jgi:hypothetical protein